MVCLFLGSMKPTDSLEPSSKTKAQYQGFMDTPSLFLDVGDCVKQPLFAFEEVSPLKKKLPELKKNTMLGKRAELFFKQQIEGSKDYKVLADGVQVFKDKRTVGELDFIVQHRKSLEVFHTELTYKFYAYDPNITAAAIEKWIGPNRKDTLLQKLEKLNTRQFPLLHTRETQQTLKKLGLPLDGIAQRLVFKAQLFVPENTVLTLFPEFNKNAIRGNYMRLEALTNKISSNSRFFLPKKQDWMLPAENNRTWLAFSEIENELANSLYAQKSRIIWSKDGSHHYKTQLIVWW
nr:DUF1853 family protein [Flavicella sp.]